jgi:hypothetical protein
MARQLHAVDLPLKGTDMLCWVNAHNDDGESLCLIVRTEDALYSDVVKSWRTYFELDESVEPEGVAVIPVDGPVGAIPWSDLV